MKFGVEIVDICNYNKNIKKNISKFFNNVLNDITITIHT